MCFIWGRNHGNPSHMNGSVFNLSFHMGIPFLIVYIPTFKKCPTFLFTTKTQQCFKVHNEHNDSKKWVNIHNVVLAGGNNGYVPFSFSDVHTQKLHFCTTWTKDIFVAKTIPYSYHVWAFTFTNLQFIPPTEQ